ncbi:MAG: peptide chain release factor-like protein [Phycisphaerales bacterium]|nr:peptide chain release factor-like protein [Phycisphaerales bacterium]
MSGADPLRPPPPPPRPAHPAGLSDEELLGQCEIGKGRSSGPGGQHRNKVETKVTLTHLPTGVMAQAGERRSAEENKKVAVFRLRLALAMGIRRPVPIGDVRSELWRSRCRGGRIAVNPEHRDYPVLLAEALEVIEACGLDAKKAALRLECSASQLIKLVKDHPPAMERWNRQRAERGLHALH